MKYALKNAIILNGTKDLEPITGVAVLVDRERIADIVPETEIPNGFEVVDLGGAYLLPGLINLHVHLATSGKPPKAEKKPPNYKLLFQILSKSRLVLAVIKRMTAGAVACCAADSARKRGFPAPMANPFTANKSLTATPRP